MMHNDEHYNYWGMHMGWWFFLLVIVIVIAGWIFWSRKRK
jgi:LPXTG-motif cell wall-anchored protein